MLAQGLHQKDPLHSNQATSCATKAASRLKQIRPRWIPQPGHSNDEPVPDGQEGTKEAFVPPVQITSLPQAMRALTNREGEPRERPAPRACRRQHMSPRKEEEILYIAGILHVPDGRPAVAAAGFTAGTDEGDRAGKRIPDNNEQSQYVAEFYAALLALRSVHKDTTLTIFSAKPYIWDAIDEQAKCWAVKPHKRGRDFANFNNLLAQRGCTMH
ncbi:hypothetical protein GGX14DRAFT_408816 [Mycena pura]|uniref:RNase H type-1 domain-containing protein n=1 Tax=Mycena pura TaxID=153505 RepID=A0AAD6XZ55_9AGAR|nr:hypothetical protein GGX14DRAFT_408816 [Mycena pura]